MDRLPLPDRSFHLKRSLGVSLIGAAGSSFSRECPQIPWRIACDPRLHELYSSESRPLDVSMYPNLNSTLLVEAVERRLRALGRSSPDRQLAQILGHDTHAIAGCKAGTKLREATLKGPIALPIRIGIDPLGLA